jgi:hypothetical protein
VLSWVRPPTEDDPAATLRWVRRLHVALIPGGVLMALLLWSEGLGAWWLGLVVSACSALSLATIGSAIRRAERHGPNDPATRPQRMRRAERVTLVWAGAMAVVSAAIGYALEGAGLAIALVVLTGFSAAAGIWGFRRWIA